MRKLASKKLTICANSPKKLTIRMLASKLIQMRYLDHQKIEYKPSFANTP